MKKNLFHKAILHFGSEKTGTTSIQAACDQNRVLLEDLGIYYPSGHWHCELASCFSSCPENEITNIVFGNQNLESITIRDTNYMKNLRHELSERSCDYLLLSCESFNFLDEKAMSDLRLFVLEFAEIAEVIYYVRSPVSYAISARSQHVKMGIDSYAPIGEYAGRLEKMVSVFGIENIHVRKFSRDSLLLNDVVVDFLSFFHIPMQIINEIAKDMPVENSALSLEGFLVGEKIREIVSHQNLASINFMRKYEHKINKIKGQKLHLSEQETKDVIINSQHDVEYLEREFGIVFHDVLPQYSLIEGSTLEIINSMAEFIIALAVDEHDLHDNRIYTTAELKLLNLDYHANYDIFHGQALCFEVEFALDREIAELEAGIHIWDKQNRWAFGVNSTLQKQVMYSVAPGIYRVSHYVVADLPEGVYTAGFAFAEKFSDGSSNELMWYDKLCEFRVSHSSDRVGVGYANLPSTQMLTQINTSVKNIITNATGRIVSITIPVTMQSSENITIDIDIHNDTDVVWKGDLFRPINLSYHWLDENDDVVLLDGIRTPLPDGGVAAHGTVTAKMQVMAPETEGVYRLVLTMVQESVGWFEKIGLQPFVIDIMVK